MAKSEGLSPKQLKADYKEMLKAELKSPASRALSGTRTHQAHLREVSGLRLAIQRLS